MESWYYSVRMLQQRLIILYHCHWFLDEKHHIFSLIRVHTDGQILLVLLVPLQSLQLLLFALPSIFLFFLFWHPWLHFCLVCPFCTAPLICCREQNVSPVLSQPGCSAMSVIQFDTWDLFCILPDALPPACSYITSPKCTAIPVFSETQRWQKFLSPSAKRRTLLLVQLSDLPHFFYLRYWAAVWCVTALHRNVALNKTWLNYSMPFGDHHLEVKQSSMWRRKDSSLFFPP